MKTLLIITGPQGSGNHLWSKILSADNSVWGWKRLLTTYWIPHSEEPFAMAWDNPQLLKDIEFGNYAITSISCPYAKDGKAIEPKYVEFVNQAKDLGYNVKVGIIGRDANVLRHQQKRVRGTVSYNRFEHHLHYLQSLHPVYLSTELLYLYKKDYIRSLSMQLQFPINIEDDQLAEILKQDPNEKYFKPANEQPLDNYVRTVSGLNNING